jgi:hypothetical protein
MYLGNYVGTDSQPHPSAWFFQGPFQKVKDRVKWKDWKAKCLRSYQEELLDLYESHGFKLLEVLPEDKFAAEDKWPTLKRREASLVMRAGGNIAVKCGPGRNNGVLVVDLDKLDEIPAFWKGFDTLTVRTGRGFHLYFYLKEDSLSDHEWERAKDLPQVNTIRYGGGLGMYALLPLSIHPTGKVYDFLDWTKEIAPFEKAVRA